MNGRVIILRMPNEHTQTHAPGSAAWRFDPEGRVVVPRPDTAGRVPIQMLACGSEYFAVVDALLRGYSGADYARMLGEFDGPLFPKNMGRAVWIRDPAASSSPALFCATGSPALPFAGSVPSAFESTLDLGEVTLHSKCGDLETDSTVFVPVNESCECWDVRITNRSDAARRIDVSLVLPLYAGSRAYVEYHRDVVRLYNKIDAAGHVLVENGLEWIEGRTGRSSLCYIASARMGADRLPDRVWSDREDFLGPLYRWDHPEALIEDREPRIQGLGRELVAAFEFRGVSLTPGESVSLSLSAGVAPDRATAARIEALAEKDAIAKRREEVSAFWSEHAGKVRIETGHPDFDSSWNRWWLHQSLIRHWFGNTGHPQFDYGSDFSGWREIWQDLMAWAPLDPAGALDKSVYTLSGIRPDGTNATRFFTRTRRFGSDEVNGLWCDHPYWTLPTMLMIGDELGDLSYLLKDGIPYFRDTFRSRGDKKTEGWPSGKIAEATAVSNVNLSQNSPPLLGTVIEHLLVQNLGMYYDCGRHGLLKHRRADWNDAIDQLHDGENVVFSCGVARNLRLLASALNDLASCHGASSIALFEAAARLTLPDDGAAPTRQDAMRKFLREVDGDVSARRIDVDARSLQSSLESKADTLVRIVREKAYNGTFFHGYIRPDGQAIEEAGECPMHLMPQTWALLADAVSGNEVDRLIEAVFENLSDAHGGLRLNAPAYTRFDPEIGRITGFAPGTKENGAVFNHANLYFIHALLLRRRAQDAWKVFSGISVLGRDRAATAGPHLPEYWIGSDHPFLAGRAEYPLLTGTGPWTRMVFPRHFLGVRGVLTRGVLTRGVAAGRTSQSGLLIDPCLPDDDLFRDVTLKISFRGARYRIRFRSPAGVSAGRVRTATLDGRALSPSDGRVMIGAGDLVGSKDGEHVVDVELG